MLLLLIAVTSNFTSYCLPIIVVNIKYTLPVAEAVLVNRPTPELCIKVAVVAANP